MIQFRSCYIYIYFRLRFPADLTRMYQHQKFPQTVKLLAKIAKTITNIE